MRDDFLICLQGAGFQSVEYSTGILQALEEYDYVPGKAMTSSGASLTMALYYSQGLDWILKLMAEHEPTDFFSIDKCKLAGMLVNQCNYFIDTDPIRQLLEENMTAEATLRQLVGVTRLKDFKHFMVPATPATVLASTAIECCMKPVEINGEVFSDSGLINNVPLPTVQECANYKHIFIGVEPQPKFNNDPQDHFSKYLLSLIEAIYAKEVIQIKEAGYCELPNVTFIEPPSALGSGLLNWSPDFQFQQAVYEQTKELIKDLSI